MIDDLKTSAVSAELMGGLSLGWARAQRTALLVVLVNRFASSFAGVPKSAGRPDKRAPELTPFRRSTCGVAASLDLLPRAARTAIKHQR